MFRKTVLDNGISVISEMHPTSKAVSVGVWIKTGTRDEKRPLNGISHFVEHLVFKGTKKRSSFRLARELEAVGGDLNAFTTRECTCFHTLSLKEDLELSLDVLLDIVKNATFPVKEIPREKGVVIQEIAMSVDNPEEYLFDAFQEKVYGDHPLGWPILGTTQTIESMKRKDIVEFYKRFYNTGSNVIVSVAGFVDHDKVVEMIEKRTPRKKSGSRKNHEILRQKPKFESFRDIVFKEHEQSQILVAFEAPSFKDKFRFEAFIWNALLGGGMTSKLYQSIREKKGLAYSVYSQLSTFVDCGQILVYAGTEPSQMRNVVEMIFAQVASTQKKRVKESELDLFKTQVRGAILLGSDDIENRMNSLGVNEMVFGEYRPVEKVIEDIDGVNVKSFNEYKSKHFSIENPAILIMGNHDESDRRWLKNLKIT